MDAQRIALIMLRERDDRLGERRREHQRAPLGRCGFQDELEILAKAEIEHLVRFVEHDSLELGDFECAALQMVAQPSRRSHHDMHAVCELAPLAPRVHAADASNHTCAGIAIKPAQLALNLHRKFPRGRNDQRARRVRRPHRFGAIQQSLGDGNAVGDCLPRTRLRRDEQVASLRFGLKDGRLHGGRFRVVALRKRAGEGGRSFVECQMRSLSERTRCTRSPSPLSRSIWSISKRAIDRADRDSKSGDGDV